MILQNKFISHKSEGWDPKINATSIFSVLWEPTSYFSFCLYMAEWARKLFGVSVISALIPFMRTPFNDLITYQRPYLQMPSHWDFNIWILRRQKHLVYGRDISLWFLVGKQFPFRSYMKRCSPLWLKLFPFWHYVRIAFPYILLIPFEFS